MEFSEAFGLLRGSDTGVIGIRLTQWNPEVLIKVQVPDGDSKMSAPYLYVTSHFGNVPWVPTQIELFKGTWAIIYEEE